MKTKRCFYLSLLLTLFFSYSSFSQQTVWKSKLNSLKTIIENNGQFSDVDGSKVLFAYLGDKEKYYFTERGMVIQLDTSLEKKDLLSWATKTFSKEEEEKENVRVKSYFIRAEWENASSAIMIEKSDQFSAYYTFRNSTVKSYGYKRIIYKNVYPNIDIEYTLPGDSSGIKYNMILNPGANVSDIKLNYSGDVNKIMIDSYGNLLVETPVHNIVDHKPKTYYTENSEEIESSFMLENNTVSVQISNAVTTQKIIIDPWVNGLNITGDDYGYNVEYDDNNNMFVYTRAYTAGQLYVSKYSPMGTMLWTHLVTTNNSYEGNIMVDRLADKIYISEGFNGGGAKVYRLYNTGVPDGFMSQVNSAFVEIWDMAFDVIFNRIIGFGGGTASNLNGGIINPITGSVNTANFTGVSGICQDIVCGVTDYDGKLFVLYSQTICGTPQMDNKLELVNNYFNGPVWVSPSGYSTFLEASNHIHPVNGQSSNGFNALAVNDNFLYYYDGGNLAAYNKTTGLQLGSTLVGYAGTTSYTPLNQGGIAVDDCDNVFVGGPESNMLIYHFDGVSFSFVSQLKLLWMGNQNVFDIKFDRNTNLLYVSGYNNIGVYNSPVACNLQTCAVDSLILEDIQCVQNNHFDLNGFIYAVLPQDSVILSVSDQSSYITQTLYPPFSYPLHFSIPDIPSTTEPHIINVVISGSIVCGYSFPYTPPVGLILTGLSTNPTCTNNNGSAIIKVLSGGIPPYSYLWSNGSATIGTTNTTDTITNLFAGVYSVTVTNNNGCTSVRTFSISDGTLTASVFLDQSSTCSGTCDGSAHVNINGTGLVPPFDYHWSNGQIHLNSTLLSDTCMNLCSGLIAVTVTDNIGCIAVSSLQVNDVLELSTTFTFSNPSCAWSSNGIAFANVENGLPPYTYLWSNGQTNQMAQNLSVGNYFVTITDSNGCSISSSVSLTAPAPVIAGFTFLSTDSLVQFTNTSTGSSSYLWDFGDGTTSVSVSPTHIYTATGTYQVCLTVQNCDTIVTCQNITILLSGINQINSGNIIVYPNPAHDFTMVKISQPGIYKIKIFDIAGKLEKSYEGISAGEFRIKTSDLGKGFYFIKILNSEKVEVGFTKLTIK